MAMLMCEVVTPTHLLYRGPASLVECPSVLGRFGVLPGHEMFSCRMASGLVTIYTDEDKTEKKEFASYMGFAQVDGPEVIVLCREGIELCDIDVADVKAKKAELEGKIAELSTEQLEDSKKRAHEVIRGTYIEDLEWCDVQLQYAGA